MSKSKQASRFQRILSEIFADLGNTDIREPARCGKAADFEVVLPDSGNRYLFDIKARERVTPQIADALFKRTVDEQGPPGVIRVIFAPVISDRVAQMARAHGISYLDYVGNCYIVDPSRGLLISRTGIMNDASTRRQSAVDVFSPKSSRIVRAMLQEPKRGWQVSELARHVHVSAGLASKVKDALIQENYAVVRGRLLYLKAPADLLSEWSHKYSGPSEQRQFYMRGDLEEIEERVTEWCQKTSNEHALARFSAAWRLAPEVRYAVASVYVGNLLDRPRELACFCAECGAQEVDEGGNLLLLVPFDMSVFANSAPIPERATSPLQTYLDLKGMPGRAEEAAVRIYEKYLRRELETTGAAI